MFLRNDTNTSHNHMSIPIQYQYHDFVRFQYQYQYQYLWDSFCNTETNTNTCYILLSIPIPIRYRKYRKFSISIPILRRYRLVSHSTDRVVFLHSHYVSLQICVAIIYTGIYITNDIFAFSTLVKKVHFLVAISSFCSLWDGTLERRRWAWRVRRTRGIFALKYDEGS